MTATSDPTKRRWLSRLCGPVLLTAGLLPALAVGWQALPGGEALAGWREQQARRAKILAAIPGDPSVLINVTAADMPATPDILQLGKRSTKALERCVADNVDESLRRDCAQVLAALGDKQALATLQAALDDWDEWVRLQVVRALGAMPDPSSVAPLVKLFERKDEQPHVRREILRALAAISDARVVKLARAELRHKPGEAGGEGEPVDFRAEAFATLWANRHLTARATLVADTRAALGSDNGELVRAATLAAAELRAPELVGALVPLMEHHDSEIRNKAVYALGRIGDKKATAALLAKLPEVREARMLNNIAFALERLDKSAFYQSIRQVAEHKQAIIRLNAAFVLGDVRHAEGLPLLEKALGDASDYVRTSAIVAVGRLGSTNPTERQRALAALEPFLDDPNLSVRSEAVYATHALSEKGRPDLVHDRLFATLDREKQRAAIERAAIVLGKAGDVRVRSFLLECLLGGGCTVGDVQGFFHSHADDAVKGQLLLGWTRQQSWLDPLVGDLRPDGMLPVAKSALAAELADRESEMARSSLRVLGGLGDASARPVVERYANTAQLWPRIFGNVALVRLGEPSAAQRLLAEIDNLPAEWLPRYAYALGIIAEPAARSQLDGELEKRQQSPDAPVALAAAAIRLRWTPDAAVFRFLDALASPSAFERDLGERYLARDKSERVTWLLRRALAREGRADVRDRLRAILDERG